MSAYFPLPPQGSQTGPMGANAGNAQGFRLVPSTASFFLMRDKRRIRILVNGPLPATSLLIFLCILATATGGVSKHGADECALFQNT